jgi:biopolymer transport protein ExbD
MITTPLISQSNIKVNLPETAGAQQQGKILPIQTEITITREGIVYLDGKIITRKELKEEMRLIQRKNPDLTVTVRSDKFVKFQDIVNVLDPLTELGITKLNIAAMSGQ